MISSPSLAIGWQLWRRNRTGAIAAAATLLVLAGTIPGLFVVSQMLRTAGLDQAAGVAATVSIAAPILPLFCIFSFFMNALLFTEEQGNIASGYPRRMFPLPVRTATLVLCPMGCAAALLALLWFVTALLYRPVGVRLPLLLPAMGLVVSIVSLQAVAWSPFANSWGRVVLSGIVVPAVATGPLLLFALGVSHGWVALALAAESALAVAVALAALRRSRHGELWTIALDRLPSIRLPRVARLGDFRSAADAQTWFEWRCHGLVLPLTTAGFASLILLAGLVGTFENPSIALGFFGVLLGLPLFLAGSIGGVVSRMQPLWVRAPSRVTFVATRPMTSGGLAAAKFRVAGLSALLTAGVAVVILSIACARHPAEAVSAARTLLALLPGGPLSLTLLAVLYPLLLWRQATDALPSGLAGRKWLSNAIEYAFAAFVFAVIGVAVCLVWYPGLRETSLAAVPWIVAGGAAAKVSLAGWAYRKAVGLGLMSRRVAVGIALGWLAATTCLICAVWALVPPERLMVGRAAVIVAGACFLPLSRFALAPLALDWNRHR